MNTLNKWIKQSIYSKTHAQALFLFDNAPSHKKYTEDALNADKMNVCPGGKQPKVRDTVFNSQVQSMILPRLSANRN